MRLERSDAAVADVDGLWTYVAQDSERAADQLVDRLDEAFQSLLAFPRMGLPRADLAPNLRALRVDNLIVFYRVEGDVLSVERILHARMDATRFDF